MDLKAGRARARAAAGLYGLELAEMASIVCALLGIGLLFGVAVLLIVGGLAGTVCFERATTLRDRAKAREATLQNTLSLNERIS